MFRIKSPERSSSGDRTNPQQNHQYRSNPHQQNHQHGSNSQQKHEYRTAPEQKQEYRTVPEQKHKYKQVPEQKQEFRTVPEEKQESRTVPEQSQQFRSMREQNYDQLPQGELKIVEVLKTPHPIYDDSQVIMFKRHKSTGLTHGHGLNCIYRPAAEELNESKVLYYNLTTRHH